MRSQLESLYSLIVFGGKCRDNLQPEFGVFYALDLSDFTWKRLIGQGLLPCSRIGHTAIVNDNEMIVYGGSKIESIGNVVTEGLPCDEMFRLHFKDFEWELVEIQQKKLPGARSYHTMCIARSNRLMMFGGLNHKKMALNDLWLFDVVKQSWREIKSNSSRNIPSPRAKHSLVCLRSVSRIPGMPTSRYLILFGGSDSKSVPVMDTTYIFHLGAREWIKPHVLGWNPQKMDSHMCVVDLPALKKNVHLTRRHKTTLV